MFTGHKNMFVWKERRKGYEKTLKGTSCLAFQNLLNQINNPNEKPKRKISPVTHIERSSCQKCQKN